MVNKGEGGVGLQEPPVQSGPDDDPQQEDQTGRDKLKEVADQIREKEDALFMAKYEDLDGAQLVATGYVTHVVEIMEGFVLKLRTVTEDEDLEISTEAYDLVGNAHFINESISKMVLARAIVEVNGIPFGTDVPDRFKRVGKFGKILKLAAFDEWRMLNKALSIKIKGHSGNSLERLLIGRDSV